MVVHHDCEVKLSIGQEAVLLGIPSLTSRQLRRCKRTKDGTPWLRCRLGCAAMPLATCIAAC